jgi:hypothetical protein
MRVRPLRKVSGRGLTKASVPVKLTDNTQSQGKADQEVTPVLATEDELHCRSEYLPLPEDLDANGVTAQIDWSEAFFLPTFAYTSHEIAFTAREGQEVLRVFLAKSNSKVSIIKKGDRAVIAASRAVDGGSAQLVIATELTAGTNYVIVLEFSERHGGLDG